MKKSKKIKGLLFKLLIIVVSGMMFYLLWLFRDDLKNLSRYGYLGIFIINFVSSATVLLPAPGTASVFLGGAVWNPLLVGISAGFGAAIGELFGYFVGYGGSGLLVENLDKNSLIKKIKKYFQKSGFLTIFIFAALPIPLFDLVGIFAGAVNYPVWKFFLAVLTARILRDILFAFTGAKFLN